MFGEMLDQVKFDAISMLARIRIQSEQDVERMESQRRAEQSIAFNQTGAIKTPIQDSTENHPQKNTSTFVRSNKKVGRNDPCPCDSGKKYKQCHGKLN